MLLLGLTACQKEEATIPGVNSTTELNVTPRVKAFVDRANHHAVDAGRDAISADSAVWYLEAGVNYSTAQAWVERTELTTDTLVLPFDFSSGTVSVAMLEDAYTQLVQMVKPYTTGDQNLRFVDVVETPQQLSSGHLLVLCTVASGDARSYNNPPNTYYPPSYSASWDNTYQLGSPCAANSADLVIQKRINSANLINMQPDEYLYSVESWTVSHIPTDFPNHNIYWKDSFIASSTPNNGGVHETLFFSAKMFDPSTYPCLNATEMSYWTGNATTNGTWRGITKIRQTYCPSKYFISCTLNGAVLQYGTANYGLHAAQVKYGRVGSAS